MTSMAFFTSPPTPPPSLRHHYDSLRHRILFPQTGADLPTIKPSPHSSCLLPSILNPRPTINVSRPRVSSSSSHWVKASSESAAVVDESSVASSSGASSAVSLHSGEDDEAAAAELKVGARIRIKVPLKVYHIPKVPELELEGKVGVLKQYVGVWKGKRISANLPYKVQFVAEIEGRDSPVKFFAHLREDEFEYVD